MACILIGPGGSLAWLLLLAHGGQTSSIRFLAGAMRVHSRIVKCSPIGPGGSHACMAAIDSI